MFPASLIGGAVVVGHPAPAVSLPSLPETLVAAFSARVELDAVAVPPVVCPLACELI